MTVRVLLLTQWFDPEPTFKGLAFARELLRAGFDVEVLTGFPNYPSGRLYPGYRVRLLQRETIDGVHVTRVPLYPSHDQSAVRRVLNYASFGLSSLVYSLFFAARPDVVYAYHPPLTVGLTATALRLFRGTPIVYDIQDLWPDTLRATSMVSHASLLRAVSALCNWVYRRVDRIVVLSPGLRRVLLDRGVPECKVSVIYNWADEAALAADTGCLPENFPGPERFRIVFAGNMGKAQGLDTVLEAAARLQARESRVTFVLVGGGIEVDRLKRQAIERGLENVRFLRPVPMSEVGALLRAADALLVHLRKDPLFEITIPSKTQAYMAIGRPLLLAVAGDAAQLVRDSGSGVVVEPGDPETIAIAADELARMPRTVLEEMGRRGSSYYAQYLAIGRGTAKFANLFRALGEGGRSQ